MPCRLMLETSPDFFEHGSGTATGLLTCRTMTISPRQCAGIISIHESGAHPVMQKVDMQRGTGPLFYHGKISYSPGTDCDDKAERDRRADPNPITKRRIGHIEQGEENAEILQSRAD